MRNIDRECSNCIFEDGCKGAVYGDACSEHQFEGEEVTEEEKRGMLGDVMYQRYKEDDL